MLGPKYRDQLELFVTGSLEQLVPKDHVLARVAAGDARGVVLDVALMTGEVNEGDLIEAQVDAVQEIADRTILLRARHALAVRHGLAAVAAA